MATDRSKTHPLAGHTEAFLAWTGFLAIVFVAYALFYILAGWADLGPGLVVNDVTIPWALFVLPVAIIIYWHQRMVSLWRPHESRIYALLDFLGSAAVFVVVLGAALSWLPWMATWYVRFGVPIAPFNLNTITLVAVFLPLSFWDLTVNHWRRARLGYAGVTAEAGALARTAAEILSPPTGTDIEVAPLVVRVPPVKLVFPDGTEAQITHPSPSLIQHIQHRLSAEPTS